MAEHIGHVCSILRIEAAQVEFRQTAAIAKHSVHVRHLFCIEVRQVETCEAGTSRKHLVHVGDILRMQVFNLIDGSISSFSNIKALIDKKYSLYRFGQGLIEADIFDSLYK